MASEALTKSAAGREADQPRTLRGLINGILADIKSQGTRISADLGIIFSIVEGEIADGLIGDKKYLVSFNSRR